MLSNYCWYNLQTFRQDYKQKCNTEARPREYARFLAETELIKSLVKVIGKSVEDHKSLATASIG